MSGTDGAAIKKKCTAPNCGQIDYTEFSTCRFCGHPYADTSHWTAPGGNPIGEFLRSPFQVLIALILLGTAYYFITKHNPENFLGDTVMAVIQFGRKSEGAKLKHCNEALARNPNNVDALEKRGDVFVETLNAKAALADYTHAIELAPSRRLYEKRAVAFDSVGEYDKAKRDQAEASRLAN